MGSVEQSYIFGSEWLYYKLYTGAKTADLLLTDLLLPTTEKMVNDRLIDKWFFIRYADPKHHLRVRFRLTDPLHLAQVANLLYDPLHTYLENELVWKIQLDTYSRELKRYGEGTIEEAESLFYEDSSMIVKLLDAIEGDEGEEIRWLFGLRAMDRFLDDVGYNENQKLELLEKLKTGFGKEFGMNKSLRKQLDKKYRDQQDRIDEFFRFSRDSKPEYTILWDLLDERSNNTKGVIGRILSKTNAEELDDRLGSYLHMHMNRLFRSKNRLHELVLYDMLYKRYKIAWGKRTFNKTAKK